MSDRKGKKRSKSRSRSRERRKRHRDEKIDELENRVINLTKVVTDLVNIQKEQIASKNSQQENSLAKDNNDLENKENTDKTNSLVETVTLSDEANGKIDPTTEAESSRDDILKILGFDAKDSTFKDVKHHPELKETWLEWKKKGLPEKNKKEILQSYNRKGEFYTEAPKINLEIVPLLSEIAKKRDQHFLETQNCVGTAISALGAAVSLLLDPPKEGLDEDLFTTYISHAGQILTDVFFQQTEARKSFITPQLNKNIKPVVDSMISNEWLYGDKLKESVKDAKEIEKACADIKEKTPLKPSQKFQGSGNSKYPPAAYRPVGQQQRRFMKFKPKSNKTQRKMYKIRKFAELLGVLTSACPAVAYGFIHCKRLERQKFLALKFNGGNYERKILITDSMMEDLEGASYTTLNTARSTISLISAYDINNDGLISRFLKSVFKQRPSKPKYNSTWDVVPVLKYIEKMHPLSQFKLKEAAEKVATLLALTTAQRLQTLALVRIENIERTKTEIKIKITELTKTTKPGSVYPELVLPFYTDRPGLCVASAVLDYIDITKELRSSETKTLFIGSTKPYGPASSQTIGHWIKSLLGKAGVDTNQFSAYSTRHAAVSTAHKRGVDISTIRRCAGWTPNSQTFFKFYNKPIQTPNSQFARAILEKI
ncbi:Protein of unknown function [Cotesia congregata]|uniref:Tyr recombinase domain-containing protein n=1 Tax=Cotesia congregata TaxID=51543 RepID=A0A8J2HD77_COTCN|nr:Protein of unknown function [Cotesia congregata]